MKIQMKFQKIMCFVMLILGALAFVYAVSYLTGSMSYLYSEINPKSNGTYDYYIDGAELYIEIQSFNNMLLWFSIIMILAAVFLFITSTNKRRKYYVTNYVATGLCAGLDIIFSVISLILNASWRNRFLTEVDFETWAEDAVYYSGVNYSESTVMFDLGFVLFAIIIVASLLLVFNLVWKLMNEKQEAKLLGGAQAEVTAL